MKFIYAIAALPLVAACAQSPASIQPVSMGNAFAAIPCEQAQFDLTAERQALIVGGVRYSAHRR